MHYPWLYIFLGAFAMFLLALMWYGPLFGKRWKKEKSHDSGSIVNQNQKWILVLIMNFFSAFTLSWILGPEPGIFKSVQFAVIIVVGLIGPFIGIHYLLQQKSSRLWIIDVGYQLFAMILLGAILGFS